MLVLAARRCSSFLPASAVSQFGRRGVQNASPSRSAGRLAFTTSRSSASPALRGSAVANAIPINGIDVDLKTSPLLQQAGLPVFEAITPECVVPAIEHLVQRMGEEFEELEKVLDDPIRGSAFGTSRMLYDFPMVIDRLEEIRSPLEYAWGVVTHLMGVKNSDELRAAHKQVQATVIQAFQQVGQSKALYKALKHLQKPVARRSMSEAQIRIIDKSVQQMELGGVGLEGEAKERFNAIELELAELSTKFSNNVLDATKAFSITITNKEDIEGLPESAFAQLAQSAVSAGEKDATAENGPWRVTLDMPSYIPIMQHAKNRELREKLYRAFITRASEGETNNSPIVVKILQLKKEKANLLGYNNYAEVSLASKMAKQVSAVDSLSEMLREKARPAAERELAQLQEYANVHGHEGELKLWDITFWTERQKEALYAFSAEELRPYFPLPKVLDGMFDIFHRLFGLVITQADGKAQVWNKDVRFFDISDQSGTKIASFFLDPYSRPENKKGGAWMDVCLQKSSVIPNRLPVAYLTCNGSPPIGDTPSLMTFNDVETLFHEAGHGLQHMLTKVKHADAAGINNVEWDAVELPSQFMENFAVEESLVQWRHYETGEKLPSDLLAKLKGQKTYMAATQMMKQLYLGQLDMELHARFDPSKATEDDVKQCQRRIAEKYQVTQPLPEDMFLCGFSHIFAGGYAAGYYSYKWAEILSADAFAAFEEAGLENADKVSEIGHRFRDTVLAMGGGRDPAKVYRDFRGRDATPDALLRHSGLLVAQ